MGEDNKRCKCVKCGNVYVQDTSLFICKDCRTITRNKWKSYLRFHNFKEEVTNE